VDRRRALEGSRGCEGFPAVAQIKRHVARAESRAGSRRSAAPTVSLASSHAGVSVVSTKLVGDVRVRRLGLLGIRGTQATRKEVLMSTQTETGDITGTKDKDYNIIWFTEQCLDNALRLETYIKDAERAGDDELATFFGKAQSDSRKGAQEGKALLRARLG
jgi:hypothetical protein